MSTETPSRRGAWEFNQQLIFGEIGAVAGGYAAAFATAHLTHRPALISASLIPGTLLGGTIFWLAARIAHQRARRAWSLAGLARDIGYFTPVAAVLGVVVYDPVIFFASHFLLVRGAGVAVAVVAGQLTAFLLFLASMNGYRLILASSGMRQL